MGSMLGSNKQVETGKTATFNQPWLAPGYNAAQQAFLGQTQLTPDQQLAVNMQRSQALSPNSVNSQATNFLSGAMTGDLNNPAMKSMMNSIIPMVESRFAGGGRLNSGAAREAETSGIANAMGGLGMQAASMAPTLQNANVNNLYNTGSMQDFRKNNILQYLQSLQGNNGSTTYGMQYQPTAFGQYVNSTVGAAKGMLGGIAGGPAGMMGGAMAGGISGLS